MSNAFLAALSPTGEGGFGGTLPTSAIIHNDEPEKKRVKRSRAIQTCSMCVKRKTKCDQSIPCSACVKRGDPTNCVVEQVEPSAGKAAGVTRADFDKLKSRFDQLEAFVRQSAIETPRFDPPLPPQNAVASTSTSLIDSTPRNANNHQDHEMKSDPHDEDYAVVVGILQQFREGSVASPMGATPRQSATHTYHDNDLTLESLTDEWAVLLQMLPSPAVSQLLVDSFFDRVDWHMHVLHTQMFRDEHTQFWTAQVAGTRDYTASWLATYFMVISLGLYFLPIAGSPITPKEHARLPVRWRDMAERSLTLADWSGTPQARCVQAILLMSFYWLNTGGIDRLVVWIGAAVRIAQALGLHTLDRNAILFPNDQFAVEYENLPFFSKELGSRLFWHLCIFDWDVSYRCRNIQVMSAQDFSTPTPHNLSDEDITRGSVSAKNPLQPTTVNYEIHLADLIFLQQQWVVPRKTASGLAILPIETIISIDKLVREKARKFSTFFRHDKSTDPAVIQVDKVMPFIPLQRLNLNMEIHCRLLRLHRRCLFDDSDSAEALSSRNSSRQSSSSILAIAQEFRNSCDFATRLWWIDAYSILACVGLVASNIHLISLPDTEANPLIKTDIANRRQEVLDSIAAIKSSYPISPYTREGIRVVQLLLDEEAIVSNSILTTIKLEGGARESTFDAIAFRKIVDDAAKASLACAVDETNQMRRLAEEFNRRIQNGRLQVVPPPAIIDPLTPTRPLDPLISAAAYLTSDPFRSSNSSTLSLAISNTASDYDDDFYRSLGFLPPTVNPVNAAGARETADLFAGSYGDDAAMQDW